MLWSQSVGHNCRHDLQLMAQDTHPVVVEIDSATLETYFTSMTRQPPFASGSAA